MPIPQNIRKQDIEKAIADADLHHWPAARNARTHSLYYNGKHYPVKFIMSLASKYAGNGELPADQFISTESRRHLEKLNYTIATHSPAFVKQSKQGKCNHYAYDGVTIYIQKSTGSLDTFRPLSADEIKAKANIKDITSARPQAYKDAYALAFSASQGRPITPYGDKAVTARFINAGILEYDPANHVLRRGAGLPALYESGPVRKNISRSTTYQAVCDGIITKPANLDDSAVSHDVLSVLTDSTFSKSTRERLIDARLGQGKFRRDLLSYWNGRCAFSGCNVGAALRASHIKPWRDATRKERLDPANGLLLIANLDALFDRGLISFRDNGEMIIAPQLSKSEQKTLGLTGGAIRQPFSKETREYLAYHRQLFWL